MASAPKDFAVVCVVGAICVYMSALAISKFSIMFDVSNMVQWDIDNIVRRIGGLMNGNDTYYLTINQAKNSTLINVTSNTSRTLVNKTKHELESKTDSNALQRPDNCVSCFVHNFKYLIEANHICKTKSDNEAIHLLILIMTVHSNFAARQAIRNTWLTSYENNTSDVRYAFLLGEVSNESERKDVIKESEIYRDILKEDFVDIYSNLTYKKMMGFKWAVTVCPHAKFVMKTDDDVFLNIPNILDAIQDDSKALQTTVIGGCSPPVAPLRDVKSKWYASIRSYPHPSYPAFCSGTGYVTSMQVVSKVYEISPTVPFFHLEDIYVSLCIRKLGYHLQGVKGFHNDLPGVNAYLYKGRQLKTAHGLSPKMLLNVWNGQCRKEKTSRGSRKRNSRRKLI